MTARAYDPWGGHPIATNDNRPQTTMVERVARALAHVDGHGGFLPGSVAKGWYEPARAAIEAMRWPTERMVGAGNEGLSANGVDNVEHDDSASAWRAMIDKALAEHDERRVA